MVFQQVRQTKLADVIEAELEKLILEGALVPGSRLPAERELALQFNVSRPSLREAIQKLEARGLLTRRQGGGTFVNEQLTHDLLSPLEALLSKHPESQFDLLEFRHALEGIAAYYAAMRGTDEDFSRISKALSQIERSTKGDESEANAIVAFNIAVAEASHNLMLLHLTRAVAPLMKRNIEHNLALFRELPADGDKPLTEVAIDNRIREHRNNLIDAILATEPEKARDAAHAHLAYIEEILLAIGQQQSRLQRTLRRGMSYRKPQ